MSEKPGEENDSPLRSFFLDFGRSLVDGLRETLLWVLVGALVGGLALAGLGGYYFGWSGSGIGFLVGAVAGGLASLWFASEAA
ncbi:MAG: hypothetical protein WBN07_17570 [Woeseiaceae bacterium]